MELDTDDEEVSLLLADIVEFLVALLQLIKLSLHALYGLLCGRVHLALLLGRKVRIDQNLSVFTDLIHVFIQSLERERERERLSTHHSTVKRTLTYSFALCHKSFVLLSQLESGFQSVSEDDTTRLHIIDKLLHQHLQLQQK